MKSLYIFLLLAFASLTVKAQNTYVPDDNFEQALIDLGYDSGPLDDYVPTANINTVYGLVIRDLGIMDLTGIEDFTALVILDVSENNLPILDFSNNTALTHLYCNDIGLTNLQLTNNTALKFLYCNSNSLVTLDISNNTALQLLFCISNSLTSLDISSNTALQYLDCNSNSLTSIDTSSNDELTLLRCNNNNLTNIDVSNNQKLDYLDCSFNSLTSLNVMQNTLLEHLSCSVNNIDRLNLVNNELLTSLHCSNNELIGLNLKNGKNTNIILFDARFNPDLECIQVDDSAYSTANWTNIDPTSNFRRNCRYVATYGNRLQQELIDSESDSLSNLELSIFPNPVKDVILISLETDVNYTIHNSNGQLLLEGELIHGERSLNVSQLQGGIYVLNIIKDGISVHKKFIKN